MRKTERLTIGLLLGRLGSRYQRHIWPAVVEVARERDANLICFAGRSLHSPNRFDANRNIVYQLAGPENVDGLILLAGPLSNYAGYDGFTALCQQFRPLPLVTIAMASEGAPSVLVDNEASMYEIVSHLIEAHGMRRIAFIKGSTNNLEAISRYRAYARALADHDVPLDPNLVTQGNFVMPSGRAAVRELLDERRADFEAIVAANDDMALGALQELQARGIRIPGDMALTGFDDIEESKCITPPLTTVRQPLYQEGRLAAEMLLDMLDGNQVPDQATLPTNMIVRRSCGCFSRAVLQASSEQTAQPQDGPITALREEDVLAKLYKSAGPVSDLLEPGWAKSLLQAFVRSATDAPAEEFLTLLDDVLAQVVIHGSGVLQWQEILSVLRNQILPSLTSASSRHRAENLWQQARVMIGEAAYRAEAYQRSQEARRAMDLGEIGEALMTTFDDKELADVVCQDLPRLGIQHCFISLYEGDQAPSAQARNLVSYSGHRCVPLKPSERTFSTSRLIPDGALAPEERYGLVVESLSFRDEKPMGFAIFDIVPRPIPSEMLSDQISTALKGGALFRELERSNRDLEQFVHIASHDLQEPLRVISGYLSLLKRRHQDQLDQYPREFIDMSIDGAMRMQALIRDLVRYARLDSQSNPLLPTDCNQVLLNALANLQARIEETNAQVTYDDMPTVIGDAVQLGQVFQNLISNAIKFHKPNAHPLVHVGVEADENQWVFSVQDDGIGIEPAYLDRIFVIFQRLHSRSEYEGTGIGLSICKRIVERHGGHIWVESELGAGATFFFTLPATQEA